MSAFSSKDCAVWNFLKILRKVSGNNSHPTFQSLYKTSLPDRLVTPLKLTLLVYLLILTTRLISVQMNWHHRLNNNVYRSFLFLCLLVWFLFSKGLWSMLSWIMMQPTTVTTLSRMTARKRLTTVLTRGNVNMTQCQTVNWATAIFIPLFIRVLFWKRAISNHLLYKENPTL